MALFRRRKEPKLARPRPASASALRRERRALRRLRDQRLRDLGGLMLELYRRATIDAALHRGSAERRCACGTPILRGAHFCPSCGRGVAPLRPQVVGEETVIQTT